MAIETVKSASITLLDAAPIAGRPQTGKGHPGNLRHAGDYCMLPASSSQGSKFYMLRVPTTIIVKDVLFEIGDAMGAGTMDVGVWYGPDTVDKDLRETVIDQDFFASQIAVTSAVPHTNVVGQSGNYPVQARNMPLWEALGLAADPGGHFDIIAVVVVAIGSAANSRVGLEVQYVQ